MLVPVSSKANEESEISRKNLEIFQEYLTSDDNWNKIITKAASTQTFIITSWLDCSI